MTRIALALAAVLAAPVPSHAALMLVTTQTNDAAFELAGGFLQRFYGLPLVGGTALPPLERAVAQITGATNNSNVGLYVPNDNTGIPFVGAGVTQALTNQPPVSSVTATIVSGAGVAFTYKRVGNTVTFTHGAFSVSNTQSYYASIDGIELRTRSLQNATYTATSTGYTNLSYSDSVTSNQALDSVVATNGAVMLRLWSGITGDFTLTGTSTLSWTGAVSPPGNANLNAQIKGLDLPASVPEPASLALLGLGVLGLAALRRRN